MKIITRTIWILSLVSLFTDVASEMLYPVIPVYLKSIGYSVMAIGLLEGIAEATAGISKGYFGQRSDVSGRRLPFVQLGYFLSALSKPMMALFTFPVWVFSARSLDRLGKGIRTGARDAMLSGQATPETKGRVFGFHRSMDTLGAVIGPALALLFLFIYPARYKTLFYIAFIPGIISVFFTLFLRDKKRVTSLQKSGTRFFDFLKYWRNSPPAYRKLVLGLLIFALFNSSDMFLLLRIKNAGLNDTALIGIYIFYNVVYALTSYPLGGIGDRIGLKKVFIAGLCIFAVVYFGMAYCNGLYAFLLLFFLYGVYAAATDGITKALVSNIADKKDVATAIGTYTAFQSICTLIASTFAGFLWLQFGAKATFLATSVATFMVVGYFFVVNINTMPRSAEV